MLDFFRGVGTFSRAKPADGSPSGFGRENLPPATTLPFFIAFVSWRSHWGWLLVGALLAGGGCSNEDAEHLVHVGKVAAAKVEALTGGNDKLLGGWQAVRGDLNELGLDARVDSRLRWDKA